MEIHLKISGMLLILLSFMHIFFPYYFHWKKELAPLSLINRQIFYVHTFFIAFFVFLTGLLSILFAEELLTNSFGNVISFGLGMYWGFRLLFQFFVYSPELWKGKTFETSMHVLFSILWIYFTVVYFLSGMRIQLH